MKYSARVAYLQSVLDEAKRTGHHSCRGFKSPTPTNEYDGWELISAEQPCGTDYRLTWKYNSAMKEYWQMKISQQKRNEEICNKMSLIYESRHESEKWQDEMWRFLNSV